jgi:hypothetical protein
MDIFKLASRQKLRFTTSKGSLSTDQLWDLSLEDLDALAVGLETEYNHSAKTSFLVKKSAKDKTAKLRFDIVLDVLNTLVAENETATETREIKEHNKKILALIAEKKDDELKGKSTKELEKMLK